MGGRLGLVFVDFYCGLDFMLRFFGDIEIIRFGFLFSEVYSLMDDILNC